MLVAMMNRERCTEVMRDLVAGSPAALGFGLSQAMLMLDLGQLNELVGQVAAIDPSEFTELDRQVASLLRERFKG